MNNVGMQKLTIIKARKKRPLLKMLWGYHELLFFLSWRDILVRYKQTVLGLLWAIIRPFLLMLVFTLLFGKVLNLENQTDIPYPLIVFAGLLPWQFFSSSVQQISDSLVQNANLIAKVYFPRLIIPLSSMVTSFVDFLISAFMLVMLMIWFQYTPDYKVLYLPVFVLVFLMFSFGMGLFIATLNVTYRDFRYIIPFVIQLGFYISPVGFDLAVIPEQWRLLYSLNPLVGIIEGFRFCLLSDPTTLYWPSIYISVLMSVTFMCLGLKTFQTMERNFADRI